MLWFCERREQLPRSSSGHFRCYLVTFAPPRQGRRGCAPASVHVFLLSASDSMGKARDARRNHSLLPALPRSSLRKLRSEEKPRHPSLSLHISLSLSLSLSVFLSCLVEKDCDFQPEEALSPRRKLDSRRNHSLPHPSFFLPPKGVRISK